MKPITIQIDNTTRLVYITDHKYSEIRIEKYDKKYSNEWYNSSING